MITTLLFDIGDVLIDIDWQRGFKKMLGHAKDHNGRDLTLEEIAKKMDPGPFGSVWDDFGAGKLDEKSFLDMISAQTGYAGDHSVLRGALTELFEPLPHRITLLNEYATAHNVTVALVSDTNSLHMDYIEGYIPSIFKNIPIERRFYSHKIGLKKKNGKDIYEYVTRALGVSPQNALMIDDRIQNKSGADAIGLNFLLIPKNEDLGAALKSFNL